MSLCSWNARGLGSPRAFRNLSLLVKQHQPMMLFVMETKLPAGRGTDLKHKLRFDSVLEVPRQGFGGGILLFWKDCIDVNVISYSLNHVDCIINNFNGKAWHFSGYYGSPYVNLKSVTWTLLNRLFDTAPLLPWLVMGDFNDYLSLNDRNFSLSPPPHVMHSFHAFLDKHNHAPIPHVGPKFTWKHGSILERLDWCTSNQLWRDLFPHATLFHLGFYGSDHRVLKIMFQDPHFAAQRSNRFHFENHWLKDPSFSNLLISSWANSRNSASSPLQLFLDKQSNCVATIRNWSKSQHPIKLQISQTQAELDTLLNASHHSPNSLSLIASLQSRLDGLLLKDEIYWKQRSRVDWLRAGDKNTKFFHHRASTRKKNNFIRLITLPDGSTSHDHATITSQFLHFFNSLFTSQGVCEVAVNTLLQGIPNRLSTHQVDFLDEPYTEVEVKNALFSLSVDKAPGPDGLNSLFYKRNWSTLGTDFTKAMLHILNHQGDISSINQTIIVLIPKKKNPKNVRDFRPISLCNTFYKCLSKIIANRLKLVLHSIISINQSAFLQGRQITDNILLANEIIHAIHSRRSGKIGWAAIKLDMEKAFDRVEWPFLNHLLNHVGFPCQFSSLIMRCLSTVQFRLSINGYLTDPFHSTRGIRQGDPLSPYLFLLIAEGLSAAIRLQETQALFSGIQICRGASPLSHLLFADDSMVFSPVHPQASASLNVILDLYNKATGQLVNREKSSILFSPNTSAEAQYQFRHDLHLMGEGFISKYLGAPHCVGRVSNSMFHYLLQKVSSKLNSWNEKFFSRAGKETLIKAVVQAIPSFAMSCFKVPKSICSKIQSLIAKFWWGSQGTNKVHWKNWDSISVSKFFGGLGFRILSSHNQALLAKQAWRIWNDRNSFLHSVLKARYFKNSDFMNAPPGHNSSFTWRSILWGRHLLQKGLVWKIGTGTSIPLSAPNWIPNIQHPILLHSLHQSQAFVSFFINDDSTWNTRKLQHYFPSYQVDRILTTPIDPASSDSLIWGFHSSGILTVKSAYHLACSLDSVQVPSSSNPNPYLHWWKTLWSIPVPPKIKHFIWRAFHHILPCSLNLFLKRSLPHPTCSICGHDKESVSHALIGCTRGKSIWKSSTFKQFYLSYYRSDIKDFLLQAFHVMSKQDFQVFITFIWQIWNTRNSVLFKKHHTTNNVEEFVVNYLQEYNDAQHSQQHHTQPSEVTSITQSSHQHCLLSLSPDTPALFVDAAIDHHKGLTGTSFVFKRGYQTVLASQYRRLPGVVSPIFSEGQALLQSLKWCIDSQFTPQVVFSDCLNLVSKVNGDWQDNSALSGLVSRIRLLFSNFPSASLQFLPRQFNVEAHNCAREALRSREVS
ncbi:uncharacterized protein LOC133034293 [Cannabis sativa]|uniref:uncharacterized protein LOC133034293 n=1 Tax=Cannabis sativa TaxID=3483 RepID=UPI0029CA8DFB|nr:uncharacterized protein LOC133034293 [Cannabis sativa]